MEVGQGPNWGCSAKGKKYFLLLICRIFFSVVANLSFKSDTLDILVAGGHLTLLVPVNCFVHMVMYTYYFITATWPEYKKNLWWKRHLTELQMVLSCNRHSPSPKVVTY
jgi:hypothetical protein